MHNRFCFFLILFLCLIGLAMFFQPTANAAPLGICVSKASLGLVNWSDSATWQLCTFGTTPGATDSVYIQGGTTVTVDVNSSAASVEIADGGALRVQSGVVFALTALTIDAPTGAFSNFQAGTVVNGNVVNNGSFILSADMTIVGDLTNNGPLDCGGQKLTLKGNLTNNSILKCDYGTSTVVFQGIAVQNLGGTNALSFQNFGVDNPAGVVLNKNVSISDTLTFTSGDINTGANTLDLSGATLAGTGGGDVIGNVKRTETFATTTAYAFNSPNTLIDFSSLTTAPTDITINLAKTTPTGFTRSLPRDYTISASGAPVFTATLQLHYKSSEVTGAINGANLMVWRFDPNSNKWIMQSGGIGGSGANSFAQATNISEFSHWAITDNGGPTAVTLASFQANRPSLDLGAWLASWFNR